MRQRRASVLLAAALLAAPAFGAPRDAHDLRKVLPFIADDYPRALAAARSKDLPIFLEAWAPW
jgi:hypothetical protein